ncbi:hydrolase Nlp/P60 [Dysgonomonas sp. 216]|uniref:C40 family peptidase n=1 Tax=Dysgonomonas sp. 216 TaxID=2302934 RepID=UPI0013CF689B|nr:C40 family peptidase [Dysgonomonas sp. 216]NDW18557.1 hydrolase Nlp/P60 [Dysgonomonas sp. 216]
MKYAINLHPVLPMRGEASETSEMVTQLLFGEYCEVTEQNNSFVKIKNAFDAYEGWVDGKMLTPVSADVYQSFRSMPVFRTCVPVADIFCMSDKSIYRLTAGSLLPNYDVNTSNFSIGDKIFQIHSSFVTYLPDKEIHTEGIIPISLHFLNTPYLWGGKNIFGIDCSGFTQVVYMLNGIHLLRDASQQAGQGRAIDFEDAQSGDLFFFSKPDSDKITHVGIYMGEERIIHASGSVRIDNVNSEGIIHKEKQTKTHNLLAIKRL